MRLLLLCIFIVCLLTQFLSLVRWRRAFGGASPASVKEKERVGPWHFLKRTRTRIVLAHTAQNTTKGRVKRSVQSQESTTESLKEMIRRWPKLIIFYYTLSQVKKNILTMQSVYLKSTFDYFCFKMLSLSANSVFVLHNKIEPWRFLTKD